MPVTFVLADGVPSRMVPCRECEEYFPYPESQWTAKLWLFCPKCLSYEIRKPRGRTVPQNSMDQDPDAHAPSWKAGN